MSRNQSTPAALADAVAKCIRENNLARPYGGDVKRIVPQTGKTHFTVGFAIPQRVLDGSVKIYSPSFVMVVWSTMIQKLPATGRRIYKTVPDAVRFIKAAFVNRDAEQAESVPYR